jgi:hypothetical protein
MGTDCPACGEEYERLGQHWWGSPEHRPELTKHQHDVITGVLMGDGNIKLSDKNSSIRCWMTSLNYLEYLDDIFGCLSTGVRLAKTAEEVAQGNRDSGFSPNAKPENYSDQYYWQSRSLPELQQYADWYSSGKKVWPKDIKLTPTVLKHWYCGDGCCKNGWENNYITIAMKNEIENTDKVNKYFERMNLPTPSNYSIYERNDGCMCCEAHWTVADSKELWDYMGEPLPDFAYKWPEPYR